MDGFRLSSSQLRRLDAILREASDVGLLRRVLAIKGLSQGRTVADVASELRISRQSVYNWMAAYKASGDLDTLRHAKGAGRPKTWSAKADQLLLHLLPSSPQDCGYFSTGWTASLLADCLTRELGQPVSDDTIRRALHRLGFVWKRARYALDPDPEMEKKNGPFCRK